MASPVYAEICSVGLDNKMSDGNDRQTRRKEDPRVRHWRDVPSATVTGTKMKSQLITIEALWRLMIKAEPIKKQHDGYKTGVAAIV